MPRKGRQKRHYLGAVLPGAWAAGVQLKSLISDLRRREALVMFFEAIDRVMLRAQKLRNFDAKAPWYGYPLEGRDSWFEKAHEHALTAAWFFSLTEQQRREATEVQVVRDLYEQVFRTTQCRRATITTSMENLGKNTMKPTKCGGTITSSRGQKGISSTGGRPKTEARTADPLPAVVSLNLLSCF